MPTSPLQSKPAETKSSVAKSEATQIAGALPTLSPATMAIRRDPLNRNLLTGNDVAALQRSMGNRAVATLLGRGGDKGNDPGGAPARQRAIVQPKLTIGPANDRYEREADDIASRVMRSSAPSPLQRTGQEVEEEELSGVQRTPAIHRIQRNAPMGLAGGAVDSNMERSIHSAKHGGTSLASGIRQQLEPKLNADLSGVKVHTGAQSAQLNRDLGAKAFTHKEHIFYGAGQSPSDLKLTAHEAVHVVQQGAASQSTQRKTNSAQMDDVQTKRTDATMLGDTMLGDTMLGDTMLGDTAFIQRDIMDSGSFKSSTNTRRRGGYIKEVDAALKKYEKNKNAGTLTGLRFVLEKYLATKGDGDDEKATQARQLLAQVKEEEQKLTPDKQIEGLLPFKAEIEALAAKGKLLKTLDAQLTGINNDLREGLKKAIIESPKDAETLKAKVAGLTGAETKRIEKLIQELSKGGNPRKAAIYHSLYARCMQMASTMFEGGNEHWDDFSRTLPEPKLKELVTPIINVTKIFAEGLDLSYHQKKMRQREAAQTEMKSAGTDSLNVVVMGAGPVGMIAAIEAFLAGANVNVYEMRRTTPNRANVLKLTDPTMHKLRRMGIYGALFGPNAPKGSDSVEQGKGIAVGLLEDALRSKAEQLGIKITYGYELETITAPGEGGGKTQVRLKKYVPTRPGPEMDLYKSLGDEPAYIDTTSDLVIGATGASGATRSKLGLTSEQRKGEGGEEYIDFTAVGIFAADKGKEMAPSADKSRNNAWVVGLRTPVVHYLLTQINREQFLKFKDDKGKRDEWVAERGLNLLKYTGGLQQSSVFDITLNQAQEFVSEEAQGVLIGDEAATPHPLTGSGFNTGSSTTDLVPGLVRGIGNKNKKEALKTYSSGVKTRTDKMVGTGAKFFEKNIKQLTEMNKLPEAPKKMTHYTPEDIGVTEETQGAYDFAQQRVMAQLGFETGIHRGNLEEYGPDYEDPEKAYRDAQRRIEALYKLPSLHEEEV